MHRGNCIVSIRLCGVSAAVVLALSGCTDTGGDGASSASGAATDAAAATAGDAAAATSPGVAAEDRYLGTLRKLPSAKGKDDAQLLRDGRGVCQHLDGGGTVEDLALAAQRIKGGRAEQELGAAQIVTAIPTLCPEHAPALAKFVEEQKAKKAG